MPISLGQRSLDDLGIPLSEVTFCVVDVETTGGSPATGALTEIGAVKLRGGECLGTFQSLIDPGMAIPREITVLTGISAATVASAPPARSVLPAFIDFLGDAVVVGHNVRYDLSFLGAELERCGGTRITNRRIDTLGLARRLIRDEVPNCKLSTLAQHLRLDHQPAHRALDDALATGDLLHLLVERAASWGVLGLDDLIDLPKLAGHPQAAKLRLTEHLPRRPGVYLFRDRTGRVLYVGKATNLRARVRSYFSGDDRRKVGPLLRETHAIDHIVCHHPLEAAVREIRLIHQHEPRFNRQSTTWRASTYLRLTNEAFPRFTVVRRPPPTGTFHLGPLPSTSYARRVADAVESVVKLRRCTKKVPAPSAAAAVALDLGETGPATPGTTPCVAAQLGVACCPCSGDTSRAAYEMLIDTIHRGLSVEPQLLFDTFAARLHELAVAERFEDAAAVRDRAAAVADALRRQRRYDVWRAASRVVIAFPDGSGAEICHGVLTRSWAPGDRPTQFPALPLPPACGPVPRESADELLCLASFMEREAANLRLDFVEGVLASPLPRLERFLAHRSGGHRPSGPRG